MKLVQGRRLLTSLVRNVPSRKPPHCRHCNPNPWAPRLVLQDPYGRPRPRPIVLDTIECIKRLTPDEIKKFGYVFSKLLELPPPNIEFKETSGEKFVVKLVKFNRDKLRKLLYELAWIKSSENVVVKKMSDLGVAPLLSIVDNIPSVVKQRVSKEEANEIIAKIQAVDGVAVMELLEE